MNNPKSNFLIIKIDTKINIVTLNEESKIYL